MKTISAQWETAILICGKCSRRIGGGFGKSGRKSLAKALRDKGNGKKGRKANFGVLEVGCLKLCPKNAVVVVDTAKPGDWLVVPRGADPDMVAERLKLGNY